MADLLVKLYDLPPLQHAIDRVAEAGIIIKRPLVIERHLLVTWVEDRFGKCWADEVRMAFSSQAISCFIALDKEASIVGFSCHNTTFKGFFGPTGVDESARGKGIGSALLLRSLHAMSEDGYAYAVIGYSDADEYYRKTVGAIPIPDSSPGPYRDRIGK